MPEENSSKNGEAGGADTTNLNKKSSEGAAAENQGAAGEQEFSVPRRNPEIFDAAQKRNQTREERKKFFQTHQKSDGGHGEGGEEEDTPLTRKEYERMREEDRLAFEEENDRRSASVSDKVAISNFLSDPNNERFRKYEKQGRAILSDPAYSHADITLIFKGLAHDDALAEGAKRGAKADETSNRNSFSGTGKRPSPENVGYDPSKHREFKKGLKSGKVSFGSSE